MSVENTWLAHNGRLASHDVEAQSFYSSLSRRPKDSGHCLAATVASVVPTDDYPKTMELPGAEEKRTGGMALSVALLAFPTEDGGLVSLLERFLEGGYIHRASPKQNGKWVMMKEEKEIGKCNIFLSSLLIYSRKG